MRTLLSALGKYLGNLCADLIRAPLVGFALGSWLGLTMMLAGAMLQCTLGESSLGLLNYILVFAAMGLAGWIVIHIFGGTLYGLSFIIAKPAKRFLNRDMFLGVDKERASENDPDGEEFLGCIYIMIILLPLGLGGMFYGVSLFTDGWTYVFEGTCADTW